MALTKQQLSITDHPFASIDTALRQIFAKPNEENHLQICRHIMGTSVDGLSDEELEIYVTEFQHLIDYWLDTYEQQNFNGQTLKQVLGQA